MPWGSSVWKAGGEEGWDLGAAAASALLFSSLLHVRRSPAVTGYPWIKYLSQAEGCCSLFSMGLGTVVWNTSCCLFLMLFQFLLRILHLSGFVNTCTFTKLHHLLCFCCSMLFQRVLGVLFLIQMLNTKLFWLQIAVSCSNTTELDWCALNQCIPVLFNLRTTVHKQKSMDSPGICSQNG